MMNSQVILNNKELSPNQTWCYRPIMSATQKAEDPKFKDSLEYMAKPNEIKRGEGRRRKRRGR